MLKLAEKLAAGLSSLNPFGKSKRADDPLTNLKSANHWVDDLPTGDALMSQNAILLKLKRLNENLALLSKDRLAILMLLDEKSRDLQDTLVQQYLRNPRMSQVMESRLWHEINSLYWEIARGYHAYVLDFSRLRSPTRDNALMPLITLRAIRAFGQLLKWHAIRYLQHDEKIWLHLHKLYLIAENENFQRQKLRMYPSDQAESSCESSYLQTLMLDLANSGTLYPRQLHLVDCWLESWTEHLHLDSKPDPEKHSFSVDLSADHGPRRTRKADNDKPARHFGVAALSKHLESLQQSLRDGASPALLGLGESARTAESLELLAHLQLKWSATASREQRRSPREQVKLRLEICHGLLPVINLFKVDDGPESGVFGESLPSLEAEDMQVYGFVTERTREASLQLKKRQPDPQPSLESWVVQDESPNGYGAVVSNQEKNWLRVGSLVATRAQQTDAWRLGAIRRLVRLNEDHSSVGIETFVETPQLATLYERGAQSGYTVNGYDNGGTAQALATIWLTAADGSASVILDPAHFHVKKEFEVHGVPDIRHFLLGHPLERSEGWIRVKVEAVKS